MRFMRSKRFLVFISLLSGASMYLLWISFGYLKCMKHNLEIAKSAVSKKWQLQREYLALKKVLSEANDTVIEKDQFYSIVVSFRDLSKKEKGIKSVSIAPLPVYPSVSSSYSVKITMENSWDVLSSVLTRILSFKGVIVSLRSFDLGGSDFSIEVVVERLK